MQVTRNGQFLWRGRPKKVTRPYTVAGRIATAKLTALVNGKRLYWQAAKLVAKAWIPGFDDSCYITYRDGNIHNIAVDNLRITSSQSEWVAYMQRKSGYKADSLEERKRKLQLVADEALMTKRYFETQDMTEINKHVSDYLFPCLMRYSIHTLHMGEGPSLDAVPDAIATMYECIINGMCLYNYERYCKKLLHNLKTKGHFGYTGRIPKPIKIEVEQLNLNSLWERYKVTPLKK